MSDGIIDLGEYLRQREAGNEDSPGATFALWGAEGERSRFALPLWRTIFLAGAERGGILWSDAESTELQPLVVLDLAEDPARTEFPRRMVEVLQRERAPELADQGPEADMAVFLGQREGRRWFLVVDGRKDNEGPLPAREREDILFLAGECAGLLFLRDLAGEPKAEDGE